VSRPRTPTAVLDARGSFLHDPQRRRDDPATSGPLPLTAPENLTAPEQAAWVELVSNAPARVLANADYAVVELTAKLIVRMRADTLNGTQTGHLIACLGRLGMTPSDRSKVTASKETPNSEWDELGDVN
jgi:hypothetical protein